MSSTQKPRGLNPNTRNWTEQMGTASDDGDLNATKSKLKRKPSGALDIKPKKSAKRSRTPVELSSSDDDSSERPKKTYKPMDKSKQATKTDNPTSKARFKSKEKGKRHGSDVESYWTAPESGWSANVKRVPFVRQPHFRQLRFEFNPEHLQALKGKAPLFRLKSAAYKRPLPPARL